MNGHLKTLGLGAVALIAVGAVHTMPAPATTGGHFVVDVPHASLEIILNLPGHQMNFVTEGSQPMKCTVASHRGTTNETTTTQLDIVPSYEDCYTENGTSNPPEFKATLNGCLYRFTVAPITTDESEQTIDFVCPAGAAAVFHDPNCTITMGSQSSVNAATYKRRIEGDKHFLTLTMHAKFDTEFHGGICVFLGTKHVTELLGAATLRARNTDGALINLTAT
jgi:hypothetical protein